MGERESSPDVPAYQPFAKEELARLWSSWRAGGSVACPRGPCPKRGGRIALAVDASSQAYRLVCVRCGAASAWFETKAADVRARSGTSSMPAARRGAGDD